MTGANPIRAGVVGWPVAHSLSPYLHGIWAARAGVPAAYDAIPVEPGYAAFAESARRLESEGFAGVNVTLPHKENALRYVLERGGAVSEGAAAAGAANMISFGEHGPSADNTDIEGFAAALFSALPPNDPRECAVVLGAGGAARAVVLALSKLGYKEIVIANRTRARADEVASRFGVTVIEWTRIGERLAGADVLANATSLGMKGAPPLELSLEPLRAHAAVADIVYAPLETPLLSAARARGLPTADGLSMLIHQAIPAFKTWFGAAAVIDADLRARLEKALAESEDI